MWKNSILLPPGIGPGGKSPKGKTKQRGGVFVFSAVALLFGEAAPVYPVSEPFLTGAEAGGLFGSPVLTVFLLFLGLTALTKRVHSRDIPNDSTELGGGTQ